jgi:hypothetical protein
VPPGTSSLDPPDLVSVLDALARAVPARCSCCLLRAPLGKPRPPLSCSGTSEPPWAQRPHPECGSRILRDNSLILVITGVEAGDRTPSCCSGPESACWFIVGGQRFPVVDTWTRRRLCTGVAVSPPPVPAVSRGCPQDSCRGRNGDGDDGRRDGQRDREVAGQDGNTGPCGRQGKDAAVTSSEPAGTRSPQPVHIPGDNFSTSRRWSLVTCEASPRRVGPPALSTRPQRCG